MCILVCARSSSAPGSEALEGLAPASGRIHSRSGEGEENREKYFDFFCNAALVVP